MLTDRVPRVDIHTRLENRARDHRLRIHFPVPAESVKTAEYDGHFEIVKRQIGTSPYDPTWVEQPRPEVPQRAFASVAEKGGHVFTIANRGLPEVEVASGASSPEIALTLLRCVGWLSRDDLTTRKGHAGPFLETPGAQMQGEWEFDYSVIVGQTRDMSYRQAWNFESPLRAASTGLHMGMLPSSGSMVSVDHPSFVISAVKQNENGDGWIVRGFNTGEEEISFTLTPWRPFWKAEQVTMAEETVKLLNVESGGAATVKARGHEVVTVRFRK